MHQPRVPYAQPTFYTGTPAANDATRGDARSSITRGRVAMEGGDEHAGAKRAYQSARSSLPNRIETEGTLTQQPS